MRLFDIKHVRADMFSLVNVYEYNKSAPKSSLSGHSSFVYSVSAFPDGSGAISSGEDGTLRVWSSRSLGSTKGQFNLADTELVQTISHPTPSQWSCAISAGSSGSSTYIASGSNDGNIRFFTRSQLLMAPPTEREVWDKEISSRQLDK